MQTNPTLNVCASIMSKDCGTEHPAAGSSAKSKESPRAIELPFDAHILPGRGKWLNCLVPVVCAATEDEIHDLLTSVLYQRYVLNMTRPIVGISLPKFGTTARIIVGWTEKMGQMKM